MIEKLNQAISKLIEEKKTILLAIDGNCCAGKTTLAKILSVNFDANVFHTDDFLLPFKYRTQELMKMPAGIFDVQRMKEQVIYKILNQDCNNKEIIYSKFDCKTQSFSPSIYVKYKQLNIIEGAYSIHPEISKYYDLKIFLTIDKTTQINRIIARNGLDRLDEFTKKWIPLENLYFTKTNIFERCDIVL